MHRHCAEILMAAPCADEALKAHGSSALWASLGAVTPLELARFNAAQTSEFAEMLAVRSAGGVPRQISREASAREGAHTSPRPAH